MCIQHLAIIIIYTHVSPDNISILFFVRPRSSLNTVLMSENKDIFIIIIYVSVNAHVCINTIITVLECTCVHSKTVVLLSSCTHHI